MHAPPSLSSVRQSVAVHHLVCGHLLCRLHDCVREHLFGAQATWPGTGAKGRSRSLGMRETGPLPLDTAITKPGRGRFSGNSVATSLQMYKIA